MRNREGFFGVSALAASLVLGWLIVGSGSGVGCESGPMAGPSLPPNAIRQIPSPPPAMASPTRRDLAEAYLAFDAAFDPSMLTPEEERRWNREFDRITQMFFTGQFAGAIDALRQGVAEMARPTDDQAELAKLVQVRADPEIIVTPPGRVNATLRVRSFGPLKTAISIQAGRAWIRTPDRADPDGQNVPGFVLPAVDLEPGEPCVLDYACDVIATEMPESHSIGLFGVAKITTTPEPLSERRVRMLERLDRVASSRPELAASVAVVRARAELLNDSINNAISASYRLPPGGLCKEVELEIALLERGEDPFRLPGAGRRFRGDFLPPSLVFWRPIITPGANIACCISPSPHSSAVRLAGTQAFANPLPLIIAFHGAGGDEFMFMEAYGGGLARHASEPCVIATPRTEAFLTGADAFDALIEQVASDYPIDRDRIYLIGHSLGGVAVTNILRSRGELVAAAVGIAPGGGFGGLNGKPLAWLPPTRWIGAELDPIIPAGRVARAARIAREAGLPVESITVPDYGHTLVVNKVLKESISWLLEHRRTTRPDASR